MRRSAAYMLGPFFLCLILMGCLFEEERRAGGAQDFPNTLEGVGALAISLTNRYPEWNQFRDIPEGPPDITKQIPVPVALAKTGTDSRDTVYWNYGDTAQGIAVLYVHKEDANILHKDTLVVRYDAAAKDGVIGNENPISLRGEFHWKFLGIRHAYSSLDRNDDGILDFRVMETSFPPDQGITSRIITSDRPGLDGKFDTGNDNLTDTLAILKMRGSDTLVHEVFADADGDGAIWVAAGIDSCLLDYSRLEMGDSADPGVSRAEMQVRIRYFNGNPAASYPQFYTSKQTLVDGGRMETRIGGNSPDSVFHPGDTIRVSVTRSFPEPDSLVSYTGSFVVALSKQTNRYDLAAMLSYSMHCVLRKGLFSEAAFHFRADLPVLAGAASVAGEVEMLAKLRTKDSARLVGHYGEAGLKSDDVEIAGKRYKAVWDRNGKLVAAE